MTEKQLLGAVDVARLMGVKTAALAEVVDGWSSAELRRAQSSHSATILPPTAGCR
jgi:hypothetical protein